VSAYVPPAVLWIGIGATVVIVAVGEAAGDDEA